ncbi:MAG TPA: hypothetical protein VNZ52_03985 [Candidatus Thermoplasmatota archaeon]|nr:hypothetical protein [Candidatus Thermoplasmatota archaeon]
MPKIIIRGLKDEVTREEGNFLEAVRGGYASREKAGKKKATLPRE